MFGIYSICMSIAIFASCADFGFMDSWFGYASENFVKSGFGEAGERVVSFALLVFVMLHPVVVSGVCDLRPVADREPDRSARGGDRFRTAVAVFSPLIVWHL